MTDVHSKQIRSYNMSMIKGRDTKPELIVRKFLFKNGLRYRINVKKLPGKPDIVLPMFKTVIFVHGCFWHGHSGCKYFILPATRTDWWQLKIQGNQKRDQKNENDLIKMGWTVLTIWECELKKSIEKKLTEILDKIHVNV
jgi:DNA mismatch endonuclease (patch repair protein)